MASPSSRRRQPRRGRRRAPPVVAQPRRARPRAIVGAMLIRYFALRRASTRGRRARVERARRRTSTTSRPGSSTSGTPTTRTSSSGSSTASRPSSTTSSRWLTDFCDWLTWVGTTVAGVADRAPLRRPAARRLACSPRSSRFALFGLWEESIQTLALMLAAVVLSLLVGIPLGILAGRSERFAARDHAGARRDADRARLRVPDAGRDPLLGRPRRGGDHDDDLRDPARRPDHGARHPRRPARTRSRRRRRWARRRWQMLAKVQLPLARRHAPARASTRRSCSRSRWS